MQRAVVKWMLCGLWTALLPAALCVAVLVAAAPAAAENGSERFLPYTDVPRTFTLDPARWTSIFVAGESETVRLCLLGDSQETAPVGFGRAYVPGLNYEFWEIYGNCPESPLIDHGNGAGSPTNNPAGWLWGAVSGLNRGSTSRVPPAMMPPGLTAKAVRSVPPQSAGWLYVLFHDAVDLADGTIPSPFDYLDPTGDVRGEFVAATNPSSGEIVWRSRPTSIAPSVTAPSTGLGGVSLGLEQAGPIQFLSGLTGTLDYAGERWMVIEGHGSSLSKYTDVVGMRYRNLSRPDGVVVQTMSRAGLTFPQLFAEHGDMGAALHALDFDAFIIQLGVNDAFVNRTAVHYHDDLAALITLLRDAYGDPQLPIVAAIEVHRADAPPHIQYEFDRQAGAAYALAQDDPDLLVVNLRRITEEDLGWGPDDESFLVDLVHLNDAAQMQLAAKTVAAILGAADYPYVCPDPTGDGLVNVDDVVAIVLAFGTADPAADVDDDGVVSIDDIIEVILAWGDCL